jgi:hypothetical protein
VSGTTTGSPRLEALARPWAGKTITEWGGSSVGGTWYRTQGQWCALVSPGEANGWPGWDVDVWLSGLSPLGPAADLTHAHLASGARHDRTPASLTRALRRADEMLKGKAR